MEGVGLTMEVDMEVDEAEAAAAVLLVVEWREARPACEQTPRPCPT